MQPNIQPKFIVQIVPGLPPMINGLGDYSLALARQLRKDFGVETVFLVGDPRWRGGAEIEGFGVIVLHERSVRHLEEVLTKAFAASADLSAIILLHYVGYGYAKRGCPFWLLDGLRRWKRAAKNRRLVTLFHEIYATGPWTSSSFWVAPLQKHLAIQARILSDAVITNRHGYKETLNRLVPLGNIQITTLPVFSNIGELQSPPSMDLRKPQMVIFGSPKTRIKAYQQYRAKLESACRILGIKEIVDLGVSTGLSLDSLGGIPIRGLGVLDGEAIRGILGGAKAGFMASPLPAYFGKSGVFAAYCACGILPVVPCAGQTPGDGLEAGRHYWVVDNNHSILADEYAQSIAAQAHRWYREHDLRTQARIFHEILHSAPLASNTRISG